MRFKKELVSFPAETANECVLGAGGNAGNIPRAFRQETQESGTAAKIGNTWSGAGDAGVNGALAGQPFGGSRADEDGEGIHSQGPRRLPQPTREPRGPFVSGV